MEYFPGMMAEQTMYEDMMQYEEEMTIGQKDLDVILLAICHREVSLDNTLGQSGWTTGQIERWTKEKAELSEVKKKVIAQIR